MRPFLYTVDQLAEMLSLTESYIRRYLLHYEGRSTGAPRKDQMLARNIAPADAPKAEWRVSDFEFRKWMRLKGFKYYERGYLG
jgi:hypothetical protein